MNRGCGIILRIIQSLTKEHSKVMHLRNMKSTWKENENLKSVAGIVFLGPYKKEIIFQYSFAIFILWNSRENSAKYQYFTALI